MSLLRYPSLNGLRALSVTMVIVCHLSQKYQIFRDINELKWTVPFTSLISDGGIGVSTFFVISGFLITALMLKEEQAEGAISLKKFYARRTLRIFPAYYFILLVYFVLQKAGYMHISPLSWLTAVTYTKYTNWGLDWYTAHFWSLSIEEQFYLIWPLIFVAGAKARKIFAFALMMAVPIIKLKCYLEPVSWINPLTVFERIDSIALGCLCALYEDEVIKMIGARWHTSFCISVCVLLVINIPAVQLWLRLHAGCLYNMFCSSCDIIANAAIATIVMYSVFGPHSFWFKILNLRAISFIGTISYSIYLWQQLFIMDTAYWFNSFPANIVYILLASLGSYYLIEKPFLTLKSRFK